MKLVLVLTAEAVGPMVTREVVVAATVMVVKVVDSVEEDSEDIRLSVRHL